MLSFFLSPEQRPGFWTGNLVRNCSKRPMECRTSDKNNHVRCTRRCSRVSRCRRSFLDSASHSSVCCRILRFHFSRSFFLVAKRVSASGGHGISQPTTASSVRIPSVATGPANQGHLEQVSTVLQSTCLIIVSLHVLQVVVANFEFSRNHDLSQRGSLCFCLPHPRTIHQVLHMLSENKERLPECPSVSRCCGVFQKRTKNIETRKKRQP